MSIFTHTSLSALVGATMLLSIPAHAATHQEDVQTCRQAMTARGNIDMTAYRLRFKSAKGNSQGRTIYMKAIPTKKGASFNVNCTLDKNTVVALTTDNTIRFAKR